MQKFRVLLVDDERRYFDQIAPLLDEIPQLELVHVASQDEALGAITTGFFQLAIVDFSLRGQAKTDKDGLFVLKRLAEVRPTCERVLFTTSVGGADRREALKTVAPAHGGKVALASGYVNKADEDLRAHDLIRERAQSWLHHPVTVGNAEFVLERLLRNKVLGDVELSQTRGSLVPSADELDYVLSALFGQGTVDPNRSVDMVSELDLNPMSEGWSRSVTAWCEPRSANGHPGPRCVVKIGPRSDTYQEVTRYRAYVRYRLRLSHRVELLDSCFGDTIGAVCYSHHDVAVSPQLDLQSRISRADPVAFSCVDQLFDPDGKNWLADMSDERDMAKFFRTEYRRSMKAAVGKVRDFVALDDELHVERDGAVARFGDVRLCLPTDVELGSPVLTGPFKGCIVHGDLHGANVLTTEAGQPVLIDYRNMARGPRLLDFASLEVSTRMSPMVCERSTSDLIGVDLEAEFAAWRDDWAPHRVHWPGDAPYWRAFSGNIRRLARRNFPDATEVEYAATCLLRTLRVFMAHAPRDVHRRRLLIWLAVLTSVLREDASGP